MLGQEKPQRGLQPWLTSLWRANMKIHLFSGLSSYLIRILHCCKIQPPEGMSDLWPVEYSKTPHYSDLFAFFLPNQDYQIYCMWQ